MKNKILLLIVILFNAYQSNAQFGIQTNIVGYTAYPLLFPMHTSYELGVENLIYNRFVLKISGYYLNQRDTLQRQRKTVRNDHLQKIGTRISIKQYTSHIIKKNELPQGFYVGGYTDWMKGIRDVTIQNEYTDTLEKRRGIYISVGCNVGFTYCTGHFTLEPNVGIGVSHVSNSLLDQGGWFNLDPEIQSLSTCHFQLNVGYRF